MITFTHHAARIHVNAGQNWTARPPEHPYRDTAAQDIRDIIRDIHAGTPWRRAVAERYEKTNPWLHQIVTSPKRDLFFRQYPPSPDARILDVGAGWGQLSLPLAKPVGRQVTALEPTPERLAFIEAAARQEGIADRMHFVQADLFEIEFETRFDLICCIGVLEWVPKFREGDPRTLQLDFLKKLRAALAPGGQLVIGIENRLGLKYLLGARDDHIGLPDIAVYDAALAAKKYRAATGQELRSFTYSQAELAALLAEAGFAPSAFHAALPDYKVPEKIVPLGPETETHFATTAHIPEHDGCDGTPLVNQAELASHYRTLAAQAAASPFAPSFFITASR